MEVPAKTAGSTETLLQTGVSIVHVLIMFQARLEVHGQVMYEVMC